MMKSVILALTCLLLNACVKEPSADQWLNDCYASGFYFKDHDIVFVNLPENSVSTYILRNQTAYRVMLDRDYKGERPGASAGWMSSVSPGNASAIVIDKPQIYFYCTQEKDNQYLPVDCGQVLSICQKTVKNIHSGSYWLFEDKPLDVLWKSISKRNV